MALYSPNNVLVYYNRAGVYAQLGEIERAVEDYTSAIKLYPDFANAYIYRGRLRELLRDPQGAKEDRSIAQRKIAEYRSRLNDSTYSIYADTTQRFDRLLSFDSKFAGGSFDRITGHNGGHEEMRLLPLFKFTLMRPDSRFPQPNPITCNASTISRSASATNTSPSRAARATSRPTRW